MRRRKREQSRGAGGMLPWENLQFKPSEMARTASKISNNNKIITSAKITSYNLAPRLTQMV